MTEAPFKYQLFFDDRHAPRSIDDRTLRDLLVMVVVEDKRFNRMAEMGMEFRYPPHLGLFDIVRDGLGMAELESWFDALPNASQEALTILDDASDTTMAALEAVASKAVVEEADILALLEELRALLTDALAKARALPRADLWEPL